LKVNRRDFVKTGVAVSLVAGLKADGQPKAAGKPKTAGGRPNVLYVFSDQHRASSMPGEAFNEAKAPNLDAFRRANFSMDTCVSNFPLCTPYRGILMTGKYSCQSGMVSNSASMRESELTLGKVFQQAGYHTGYVGKWHLGHDAAFIPPGAGRAGFETWNVWSLTNQHYTAHTYDPVTGAVISPEGWNATRMTDQAVEFVKTQAKDKPWMLMLSWNPPHPPFDPPAEDQKPYTGSLQMRPNVTLPEKTTGGRVPPPLHSEATLHAALQGYYGGIAGVDLEFARLLKTLDETGHADNTIVIYTSDHGEMMGSQGRMSKQVPYEESCRVPFFVRYPGVTVNGGKSDALFAAVDIYPTVCGLAGLAVPAHCAGRDHSAMMRGESMKASEMVFLMAGGANSVMARSPGGANDQGGEGIDGEGPAMALVPIYRGVRTKTHTYAVTNSGRWLLFDNVADPYQRNNLIGDAAQKPLMQQLDAALKEQIKRTGDPFVYPSVS
jgi:arylsulfatase A-like enzyme